LIGWVELRWEVSRKGSRRGMLNSVLLEGGGNSQIEQVRRHRRGILFSYRLKRFIYWKFVDLLEIISQ
jgi:hypothetical protein